MELPLNTTPTSTSKVDAHAIPEPRPTPSCSTRGCLGLGRVETCPDRPGTASRKHRCAASTRRHQATGSVGCRGRRLRSGLDGTERRLLTALALCRNHPGHRCHRRGARTRHRKQRRSRLEPGTEAVAALTAEYDRDRRHRRRPASRLRPAASSGICLCPGSTVFGCLSAAAGEHCRLGRRYSASEHRFLSITIGIPA